MLYSSLVYIQARYGTLAEQVRRKLALSISWQEEIVKGVACLKAGGLVVFPTDTLYGVGADVFNIVALRRVFELKGRPLGLALPVLVSSWKQVESVAQDIPEIGCRLAQQFWPGPLTLVLPRFRRLPDLVTGGLDTVAVRMPDHPIPLALAREFGGPITGTSANPSGGANLLTLEEVEAQLGQGVGYITRCGAAPAGVPSTVVDVTTGTPRLVREGALNFETVVETVMG